MTITGAQDAPTAFELANGRVVWHVLKDYIGTENRLSAEDLEGLTGIDQRYISRAVRAIQLAIAPKDVVIVGQRGPGGGFYVAADKSESKEAEEGRINENRHRLQRDLSIAKARLVGLRGQQRANQLTAIQMLEESLYRHEEALYRLGGHLVGTFGAQMAPTP